MDNFLNSWILITKDTNYENWITAYLHGGVPVPPKYDSLAGDLFYIEALAQSFATGRFISTPMNPTILDLKYYEFIKAPKSMVEPFLTELYNKIKVQSSAPLEIFPQFIKDYIDAKVTNEAI